MQTPLEVSSPLLDTGSVVCAAACGDIRNRSIIAFDCPTQVSWDRDCPNHGAL